MMKFNLKSRHLMMFRVHVSDINWCLKFKIKTGSNVFIFQTYVTDNYRANVE